MKNKSVLLGIAIIISVIVATTGCVFHNYLSPNDFKKEFKDLGYRVVDTDTNKYESKIYLEATKEDLPYTISYYEFDNEMDAKNVYQKYKSNIADYITTNSENIETTGSIFSKTVAESEGEYIVISRVKNSLIFVATTKEYKDSINNILENLKY